MPKLDLTDEQKELLKGLQEKHREIQKQFREKVKNLNQELWELRKDAEANAAEIEGLRDEMFNLRIEQMKSAYLHRKEIKKVFTAEQLKTMAVWRSQIRENRAGINRRMPRGGQFMTRGRNPAAGRFMGRMQFPRCRVMWRDWFWRFRW
jgi:Spy/CpxP family protein refolding chaperone